MTHAAATTTSPRAAFATTRHPQPSPSGRLLGPAAAGLFGAAALAVSGLGPSVAPAQAETATTLTTVQNLSIISAKQWGGYARPRGIVADPAAGVDISYSLWDGRDWFPQLVWAAPDGTQTTLLQRDAAGPEDYAGELARDGHGNIYIGFSASSPTSEWPLVIRRAPSGWVSNIALQTSTNNQSITDLAVNSESTVLYVADPGQNRVDKGTINADNTATLSLALSCSAPSGLTLDAQGNLYVVCTDGVHKVTPAGVQSLIAVSGLSTGTGQNGSGIKDVAVDPYGDIFVSDRDNRRLVAIGSDGIQRTIPVNTGGGRIFVPWSIAFVGPNKLYITEPDNNFVDVLTLSKAPSTTTVSCTPSAAVYPGITTCTVSVTVTADLGNPTGTVSWAAGGSGTLSDKSCALSSVSAKCSVKYTTTATDAGRTVSIAATYSGDTHYKASEGKAIVSVTKAV